MAKETQCLTNDATYDVKIIPGNRGICVEVLFEDGTPFKLPSHAYTAARTELLYHVHNALEPIMALYMHGVLPTMKEVPETPQAVDDDLEVDCSGVPAGS